MPKKNNVIIHSCKLKSFVFCCDLWCFVVFCGDLWCFRVICGDLWCFRVICGDLCITYFYLDDLLGLRI